MESEHRRNHLTTEGEAPDLLQIASPVAGTFFLDIFFTLLLLIRLPWRYKTYVKQKTCPKNVFLIIYPLNLVYINRLHHQEADKGYISSPRGGVLGLNSSYNHATVSWICLGLSSQMPGRCPCRDVEDRSKNRGPKMAPLDMKRQLLYSEDLSDVWGHSGS